MQNPEDTENPIFDHHGIVHLKAHEEDESRLWLVTRKPDSPSIAKVMETQGTFTLKNACSVFFQVSEAAAFLHGQGYMHGMICPDTIFFDKEHCFLGWSPDDSSHHNTAQRQQTPGEKWTPFIAPEIRSGHTPDSRCDVFSLGVLLHWMLTGITPQKAGVSPKIPRSVAHIIRQAVDPSPNRRFQTVSALTDALGSISEDEVNRYDEELYLAVNSAGFDPRLLWRRHPKAVLAAAACVLILAIGARWLVLARAQQQRQQEIALQKQQERQERIRRMERQYDRAGKLYAGGEYKAALEEYKQTANQSLVPRLVEPSIAHIARCYGKLEHYSAEYTTWFRLLRKYPDSKHAGEANDRIVWIAAQTVKRYGDLRDIRTQQEFTVDGMLNDWQNIDPLLTDPEGDNLKGGDRSDLVAFYAAVNRDRLYLAFETAAPPRSGDQFCLAIDLNAYEYADSSEHWDYQIGVADGIKPWIWDLRGYKTYENSESRPLHGARYARKECIEVSFPLTNIGTTARAGFRPFLNYQDHKNPNDGVRRKVLVKWQKNSADDSEEVEPASLPPESGSQNRPETIEDSQEVEKNDGRNASPKTDPAAD